MLGILGILQQLEDIDVCLLEAIPFDILQFDILKDIEDMLGILDILKQGSLEDIDVCLLQATSQGYRGYAWYPRYPQDLGGH